MAQPKDEARLAARVAALKAAGFDKPSRRKRMAPQRLADPLAMEMPRPMAGVLPDQAQAAPQNRDPATRGKDH